MGLLLGHWMQLQSLINLSTDNFCFRILFLQWKAQLMVVEGSENKLMTAGQFWVNLRIINHRRPYSLRDIHIHRYMQLADRQAGFHILGDNSFLPWPPETLNTLAVVRNDIKFFWEKSFYWSCPWQDNCHDLSISIYITCKKGADIK